MLTVRAGLEVTASTRPIFYVYLISMSVNKGIPKKRARGRPATGKDPVVPVRMPKGLIDEVEAWARHQKTSRSDAIRRLVEVGLSVKGDRK